jgi:hypothetical protein
VYILKAKDLDHLVEGSVSGWMMIHGFGFRSFDYAAQFQLFVTVHAEHSDGGAADIRFAENLETLPAEMLMPVLLARVEKQGHRLGLGIDSGEIGAFVEIAIDAGETEVRIVVAMLERVDVFDVQGGERGIFLMDLAILAAVTRVFPDQGSRGGIHAALPDLNFLASRRKTATNLFALTYPAYSSRSSGDCPPSVFFAASSSIRSRRG